MLGWTVSRVWISSYGSYGITENTPPRLRSDRLVDEEAILIAMAGRLAQGWSALELDRQDQDDVGELLARYYRADPRERVVVRRQLEQRARELVATPRFKELSHVIAVELRVAGRLDREGVERLVRRIH